MMTTLGGLWVALCAATGSTVIASVASKVAWTFRINLAFVIGTLMGFGCGLGYLRARDGNNAAQPISSAFVRDFNRYFMAFSVTMRAKTDPSHPVGG
jgi:hypothetical protein